MTEPTQPSTLPLDYRAKSEGRNHSGSSIAAALIAIVTGFILIFMGGAMIAGLLIAVANNTRVTDFMGVTIIAFAGVVTIVGLVYLVLGLRWLSRAAWGRG